jgi:hypothetical protein
LDSSSAIIYTIFKASDLIVDNIIADTGLLKTKDMSVKFSNELLEGIYFSAIPDEDDDIDEEDWGDEDLDDEDFEDRVEDKNDLHEIQVDDDLYEPDPEDDDHLPDDDLQ